MKLPPFFRIQRKTETAKRLARSLEGVGVTSEDVGEVSRFLTNVERFSRINRKATPFWVHFIFLPIIIIAATSAGHVLVLDKQSSDSLKDKALTGLMAAFAAAVGYYAGKEG
jgi:hypothetical protein